MKSLAVAILILAGGVSLWGQSPISVSISPTSVTMHKGTEHGFTAKVVGSTAGVTWRLTCDFGPALCGRIISQSPTQAVYKAPTAVTIRLAIKAISKADPSRAAGALISVVP